MVTQRWRREWGAAGGPGRHSVSEGRTRSTLAAVGQWPEAGQGTEPRSAPAS